MSMSKVYLIGAGPGDPGLMTVKGMEIIRKADCIIYDRLASPLFLNETKELCEKIYVGKANHHHTMKQEDINALLVKKANEHETVVRLKGGDVYVFGRGGEEGIELANAGIDFEVIPGVTSAIAGLAYAGIPITHRGIAGGFHVVTAHNKRDELADIDFAAMAKSSDTNVFLMGLSKLGEIASRLQQAGMPSATKAAVISHATLPEQKVCTGTLSDILEKVQKAGLTSPALIVVGDVVSLRDTLNVMEQKPAFGKKYFLPKVGTRPNPLARELRAQGAQVDEVTVGDISYREVMFSVEDILHTDWIIFTSKHSVHAFMSQLRGKQIDIRSLFSCRFAVVGKKTEQVLADYGIFADIVPDEHNGRALAQALLPCIEKNMNVWYLKAEKTDADLHEILTGKCQLKESVIYVNEPQSFDLPEDIEAYDGVYFTCASSVNRVMAALSDKVPQRWQQEDVVRSIGPKCTECLKRHGVTRVSQAAEASYEGMLGMRG